MNFFLLMLTVYFNKNKFNSPYEILADIKRNKEIFKYCVQGTDTDYDFHMLTNKLW